MQGMMNIVVPLGIVERNLVLCVPMQIAGNVVCVLQNEMNPSFLSKFPANLLGKLSDDIGTRVIGDRVNSVQPQAVKVIFLEPVERVMDEEITNNPAVCAVEIDSPAPGRAMAIGKELGRIQAQLVPLGTEVVVNHVEKDHQPFIMRALNKLFQVFRTAIRTVRGVGQNSVIAPIAGSSEIRNRHQF